MKERKRKRRRKEEEDRKKNGGQPNQNKTKKHLVSRKIKLKITKKKI
jgi:hypothetical protein